MRKNHARQKRKSVLHVDNFKHLDSSQIGGFFSTARTNLENPGALIRKGSEEGEEGEQSIRLFTDFHIFLHTLYPKVSEKLSNLIGEDPVHQFIPVQGWTTLT